MLHTLPTTVLNIQMLEKLENATTEVLHTDAAWLEEQLLVKLLLTKQYKYPLLYQTNCPMFHWMQYMLLTTMFCSEMSCVLTRTMFCLVQQFLVTNIVIMWLWIKYHR